MQQMKNMQQQQLLQQTQMQRDGSNMDMGGQRPQSPGGGDNAPSPKRQRLDGQQAFNGQMVPGGRGQGMPGQPIGNMPAAAAPNGQMLLQNGINPAELPHGQMSAFQASTPNVQQKSLEVYAQSLVNNQRAALSNHNLEKGMNQTGVPQGSPMGQQGVDGSVDFNFPPGGRMPGAPGQSQGNHALQDYQMQLMLLEPQNKKRLLMARQEQNNITAHPGHHGPPGSAPVGQPGFGAPAMSPQNSRAGPSPNPNEQMKRGTPKMSQPGLPGSPMPDGMGQTRGSPVPNFDPSQGMPPQYYASMAAANGMMRPPSSHPTFMPNMQNMTPQQMEAFARQNGGRMPNGAPWPQGPPQMMQPNPGQQPVQMGTPQQRHNNMPPPPAPAAGEAGRTNPSSPSQQAAAPPTPSQAPKSAPKGKKEANKETRKVSYYSPTGFGSTDNDPRSLLKRDQQTLVLARHPRRKPNLRRPPHPSHRCTRRRSDRSSRRTVRLRRATCHPQRLQIQRPLHSRHWIRMHSRQILVER